jgi:hypothetical protein
VRHVRRLLMALALLLLIWVPASFFVTLGPIDITASISLALLDGEFRAVSIDTTKVPTFGYHVPTTADIVLIDFREHDDHLWSYGSGGSPSGNFTIFTFTLWPLIPILAAWPLTTWTWQRLTHRQPRGFDV